MNMSDEVAGATLQVSMHVAEKGLDIGGKIIDKTIDDIAKLLKFLGSIAKAIAVKSTSLSDIKSGEVSIKKLINSARENGDTISSSDNSITKADMQILKDKAKNYGIPIAFTGDENKDNIYANVRTSDLAIYQRMCTELMKDKLEERPQELGNFKVKEWEVPFITSELNKYDLSAQFGKTKNGEHFCLYEKLDEKAIMIARNEFVKKCNELNENMSVEKDENFFTVKDKNSGKEISFETLPTREELSEQMQNTFGYDKNKSDIACAKFGEENLQGEEKQKFFSNNPQHLFKAIDTNIELQGESIFTKEYTCWRVTPKSDDMPRIVFQNDNGNFAVLKPSSMTKANMQTVLTSQLGITDKNVLNALIDKTEKVSDYYVNQNSENFSYSYQFNKSDFDMSNPDVANKMIRTDENGNRFTKTLPINQIDNDIQRTGKDSFEVTSIVQTVETDKDSQNRLAFDTNKITLSFSDKKKALAELTEIYKKQGVPEDIAKQISKEVFKKAESQNAEKILQIEEIRAESYTNTSASNQKTEMKMRVKFGNKSEEIDITQRDKALAEIQEKFDVSEISAVILLEKAQEYIENSETESQTMDGVSREDIVKPDISDIVLDELNAPDDGKIPEEMESINLKKDAVLPDLNIKNDVPNMNDITVPKVDVPTGRGGR